jgi:hypothetical protein
LAENKNYYFDNSEVQGWIEEYLSYPIEIRKVEPYTLRLREKSMVAVGKIVCGIIFKHKFTVWEPYDDLYQEAMEACTKALEKFNPNFITKAGIKATAFNYFSLTAKRCLKFYTTRNQKHRNNTGIEDYDGVLTASVSIDQMIFIEEFIKQVREIFSGVKNGDKFNTFIEILEGYLTKVGGFNKRDFFRYAKSFGQSPNLIRKFLKIIKEHKEEVYESAK